MLQPKLLLALILAITRSNAACSDDEGCSLNGQCLANSTCACYLPWDGADCGLLQFQPAPIAGAYGDLPAPNNVTSWGGNAIYNGSVWHGFFTEIGGASCGLIQWRTHSTVIHAVASAPEGPYTRQTGVGPVLQHEAHNPQAMRLNDTHWYIFHIGDGDAGGGEAPCPGGIGPPKPSGKMPPTKHPIHVSTTGPAGPFFPVQMKAGSFGPSCNNPSPFAHPNGTIYLACTWSLRKAETPVSGLQV
jgi:hypothetical protein